MPKILVWDIPTRILHWMLAVSISVALALGFLVDDDSSLFPLHMLFGIVAVFLIVLRLVLAVAGTRYARISSFPLAPREVIGYFAMAMTAKTRRYAGNNPGSALAAVLMFLLAIFLMVSGVGFGGETVKDLHESAAWALLAVVAMHLAGLVLHTLRHRENIAAAMISGKKSGEPADAIPSAHPFAGAVLLLACVWIAALFLNHDAATGRVALPLVGITMELGEREAGDHPNADHRHDEDDDD